MTAEHRAAIQKEIEACRRSVAVLREQMQENRRALVIAQARVETLANVEEQLARWFEERNAELAAALALDPSAGVPK